MTVNWILTEPLIVTSSHYAHTELPDDHFQVDRHGKAAPYHCWLFTDMFLYGKPQKRRRSSVSSGGGGGGGGGGGIPISTEQPDRTTDGKYDVHVSQPRDAATR